MHIKNRVQLEAIIYYSLIYRESITVNEILQKMREFQKEQNRTDMWMPYDRSDIMSFCSEHTLRVSMEYKEECGWIIHKKYSYCIPAGPPFFREDHIDSIYGEPWFDDKELLKDFKKKFM